MNNPMTDKPELNNPILDVLVLHTPMLDTLKLNSHMTDVLLSLTTNNLNIQLIYQYNNLFHRVSFPSCFHSPTGIILIYHQLLYDNYTVWVNNIISIITLLVFDFV